MSTVPDFIMAATAIEKRGCFLLEHRTIHFFAASPTYPVEKREASFLYIFIRPTTFLGRHLTVGDAGSQMRNLRRRTLKVALAKANKVFNTALEIKETMARLVKIAEWSGTKRGNVVFIHGLGGHPYDTWRRSKDSNTFWPRWLAEDVPGLAVHSLGYHAPASNWLGSAMPLQDEAAHCLRVLLASEDLKSGPTVFVCHSLGGLLAKNILRLAKEQSANEATAWLFEKVQSVIFIATPHTGSGKATLLEWLSWLVWPSQSVRALVSNSPHLRELNVAYRTLAEARRADLRHSVYYEKQDTAFGRIVSPASADPGLAYATPTPIPADHITIAKPLRRSELVYLETCKHLMALAPETRNIGELRVLAEESFAAEQSWSNLLPMTVRLVAMALLAGTLWWGAPIVAQTFSDIWQTEENSKETLKLIKVMAEQIARLEAAMAKRDVKPEEVAQAAEALQPAIATIANGTDARSQRAFEALQRNDTSEAEKLFAEVLAEKTKEGQAANRKAAEAARNIAAFKRIADVKAAAEFYRQASVLDPENFQNWIDLGDMNSEIGNLDEALTNFLQAKNLALGKAETQLESSAWHTKTAFALDRIGDVNGALGDMQYALENFTNSLKIRTTLATQKYADDRLKNNLAYSHYNVGAASLELEELIDAKKSFQTALSVLNPETPNSPHYRAFLKISSDIHNDLGRALTLLDEKKEALRSFEMSLQLSEVIATIAPTDSAGFRDVAIVQQNLGDWYLNAGENSKAIVYLDASTNNLEKAIKLSPASNEIKWRLADSYGLQAHLHARMSKTESARRLYEKSRSILQELQKFEPVTPAYLSTLERIESELQALDQ